MSKNDQCAPWFNATPQADGDVKITTGPDALDFIIQTPGQIAEIIAKLQTALNADEAVEGEA